MDGQYGELIFKDDDISVYEQKCIKCLPIQNCIGGYIYVINNRNNEMRWKEWRWYKHKNEIPFNDRVYVINMLSNFVKAFR